MTLIHVLGSLVQMGVKLGLLHYGKIIDWGCVRTWFWGYLDLRESGERLEKTT